MKTLLSYKSLIKATIITIIVGISASQMITYAGTPIPQTGWNLWFVDSEELIRAYRPAVNAFDGDSNTFWQTERLDSGTPPHPHEVQIDLGGSYNIEGFRNLPRQDGSEKGRTSAYEFYVSTDGATWGAPVASGTFANDATEKEVLFSPTTGQYIRFRALSEVSARKRTTMAEINVLEGTNGGGGGGGGTTGGCTDCPDAWDKKLGEGRFEVIWDGAAVLDKETCLVWEQSPDTAQGSWPSALLHCYTSEVGGRGGWRIPTIEELTSLKDTVITNPALPSGHPFDTTAVQFDPSSRYWSATSSATSTGGESENAYNMRFNSGNVGINAKAGITNFTWCVRGGQGIDGQ